MPNILAGVKKALSNTERGDSINELPQSVLSKILNSQNGKVNDATGVIVELMHFGENEKTRFEAAKEVLHLHGARRDDTNQDNRIQIIVQNLDGGDNMSKVTEIFNPNRNIVEADAVPIEQ
jgi:hypothetical protein